MISNLPDDSLLEIFQYLDVKGLEEASCVSNRMNELAYFQLKKYLKRRNARRQSELRIVESDFGHAFSLDYNDTHINHAYFLENNDCASHNCFFCKTKERREKFEGAINILEETEKYERMLVFNRTFVTRYRLVPSPLLSNLDKLLERNSFKSLVLKNVRIDCTFMSYLEKAVHNLTEFAIIGVKVDEDCVERFYTHISRQKLEHFIIRNSDSVIAKFMNEQFIKRILENKKDMRHMVFDVSTIIAEKLRFFPSQAALDGLARCNWAVVLALTVDSRMVPELLDVRLKSRASAYLAIGVTDASQNWNFDAFPHISYRPAEQTNILELTSDDGTLNYHDIEDFSRFHIVRDVRNERHITFAVYRQGDQFALHLFSYILKY